MEELGVSGRAHPANPAPRSPEHLPRRFPRKRHPAFSGLLGGQIATSAPGLFPHFRQGV